MTKKTAIDIAIVGSVTEAGETTLEILRQRKFPLAKFYRVDEDIDQFDFSLVKLALFFIDADSSREYIPNALAAGCMVIDSSSAFVSDSKLPVCVPEVNAEIVNHLGDNKLILNPTCTTVQLAVVLKPLLNILDIVKVNVATYQAVSDAGKDALAELVGQSAQLLQGQDIEPQIFIEQIAFNLLPQVGDLQDDGYTSHERVVAEEIQKLFGAELSLELTEVYVPLFYGNAAVVNITTKHAVDMVKIKDALVHAPGIIVADGAPNPMQDALNNDAVYVGRLRRERNSANGFSMWLVIDNLRKGAALNVVQIAELLKEYNYA